MSVRTTCPYCGVGCGVLARVTDGVTQILGDPEHPANRGALCSKGSALGDTVGLQGRLLRPQVRGTDVDWDVALEAVAQGFRGFIDQHGPDSVALYVSGQLLTEDYYVANKLMKGFIGSANIDTNSRLCMASAVAAHKRAFGEDLVPTTYEDLDVADLIWSFAHFEERIVPRAAWVGRIEQQAMREALPPSRGELPVLAFDVMDHSRPSP